MEGSRDALSSALDGGGGEEKKSARESEHSGLASTRSSSMITLDRDVTESDRRACKIVCLAKGEVLLRSSSGSMVSHLSEVAMKRGDVLVAIADLTGDDVARRQSAIGVLEAIPRGFLEDHPLPRKKVAPFI